MRDFIDAFSTMQLYQGITRKLQLAGGPMRKDHGKLYALPLDLAKLDGLDPRKGNALVN
jgi:hypothetical protein